jgi:von Willebrand factor type A domain/Aerotolerance regulator N-terminal
MSLANPSALLWAALAVPIIVFYILKIRLRRIPVSTILFWRQIFEEKKPRSLWQRLRHLISLLVQLIILLLLVGALAEPFFTGELNQARRVVLVVDNSASMNATDVQPTRLHKALEEARRIIAGLRHRDEMAIVVAGTQPRVVCGLTGHQRSLRDALDTITGTDGPTVLKEAITLAKQLVDESNAEGGQTRVLVISDGCVVPADLVIEKEGNKIPLIDGDRVQLVAVGQRTGNVGISRLQVRRSPLDPTGYEILIEVVNQSDDPVECRLTLTLEADVIDVFPLKLEANGKWSQVVEKVSRDGGVLRATLNYPDALAADNEAVALLPKREDQPVLLATPEPNLFLHKVLEAAPLVQLKVDKQPFPTVPAKAVQVFHQQAPNPLPPGPVLVIDPASDTDLWKVGDKLQNPIVTQQDKSSPLMANLRLDNVLMPEAKKLTFTAAAGKPQVLAGAVTGEPLYALIERPSGRVLVLTVNLDQGDLPFRTAFPIMVSNALSFFAGNTGELREALATGATAEVELPANQPGGWELRGPGANSTRKLPEGVTKTTVGPFDRCGVWSVVRPGEETKPLVEFAVNLSNRAESDLRPPADLPSVASVEQAGVLSGILGRPVWFYLIAAAWLLVAVEWWLYQRRWIS